MANFKAGNAAAGAATPGGEGFLTSRKPRPRLPPEAVNPFEYDHHSSQGLLQVFKITAVGLLLLPLRVACFLVALAMTTLFSMLTYVAYSKEDARSKPITLNVFRECSCWFVRLSIFALGYWRIRRKNQNLYGRGLSAPAPIVVANHQTLLDVFFLLAEHNTAFLGRKEIVRIPCIHALGRAQQVIEVDRDDPNSKVAVLNEVRRRAQWSEEDTRRFGSWRPLVIFPEGTCTNGRCVVQFQKGAFASGVPVQPVLVKYPYRYMDQSWCGVESPTEIVLKLMCQVYNSMDVEYLPVYIPSEEEKVDPELYATNVRRQMADALGVPTTEHNYFDVKLMVTAHKMAFPLNAVNVECGHPHFAHIPLRRLLHQLGRFAGLLYRRRAGTKYTVREPPAGWTPTAVVEPPMRDSQAAPSHPPKEVRSHAPAGGEADGALRVSQLRRRRPLQAEPATEAVPCGDCPSQLATELVVPEQRRVQVPEGFMTVFELAAFFGLESHSALAHALLTHLSRADPLKGLCVSFRAFLSALHTEPVPLLPSATNSNTEATDSEGSVAASVHVTYFDEAANETEWAACATRTFALLLAAAAQMVLTDCPTWRTVEKSGLHPPATATAEAKHSAQKRLEELHNLLHPGIGLDHSTGLKHLVLDHDDFVDRLCATILFPPRLADGTDSELHDEYDALFYRMAELEMRTVSIESFMRFAEGHRVMVEYMYATCEHLLYGDDLQ